MMEAAGTIITDSPQVKIAEIAARVTELKPEGSLQSRFDEGVQYLKIEVQRWCDHNIQEIENTVEDKRKDIEEEYRIKRRTVDETLQEAKQKLETAKTARIAHRLDAQEVVKKYEVNEQIAHEQLIKADYDHQRACRIIKDDYTDKLKNQNLQLQQARRTFNHAKQMLLLDYRQELYKELQRLNDRALNRDTDPQPPEGRKTISVAEYERLMKEGQK